MVILHPDDLMMDEGLKEIKRIVFTNLVYQVVFSVLVVLAGLALIFLLGENLPEETAIFFTVIGAILSLIGAYFLVSAVVKLSFTADPLLRSLAEEPKKIVWFYSYVVVNKPYGVEVLQMAIIYIHLLNGKQLTLRVKKSKLDQVMDTLRRLLPHATVGFSVEREQLYKANPAMLYKD